MELDTEEWENICNFISAKIKEYCAKKLVERKINSLVMKSSHSLNTIITIGLICAIMSEVFLIKVINIMKINELNGLTSENRDYILNTIFLLLSDLKK